MMELPARPDEAKWASMSLIAQFANIGSEVGRTSKWMSGSKPQLAFSAYIRALDLIDLTISCGRVGEKDRGAMLKELCRSRDLFNEAYLSSDLAGLASLDRYFAQFAKAYSRL